MDPVNAQVDPVPFRLEHTPTEALTKWQVRQFEKTQRLAAERANVEKIAQTHTALRDLAASMTVEELEHPIGSDVHIHDAACEVVSVQAQRADMALRVEEVPPMADASTCKRYADDQIQGFGDLTIEVIAKLHAALFYRQLELLLWSKDAGGAARKEILDWVFHPLVHKHSKTKEEKRIDGVDWPFSFELCCHFEEVDPEALRRAIGARLQHIKQGAGHRIRASIH